MLPRAPGQNTIQIWTDSELDWGLLWVNKYSVQRMIDGNIDTGSETCFVRKPFKAYFRRIKGFFREECMDCGYSTPACHTASFVICKGGVFMECCCDSQNLNSMAFWESSNRGTIRWFQSYPHWFQSTADLRQMQWTEKVEHLYSRSRPSEPGFGHWFFCSWNSLHYARKAIQIQLRRNQQAGYEETKRNGVAGEESQWRFHQLMVPGQKR